LWSLAQCTANEIYWLMKAVTLYFSTASAATFVCYCDFKPHLIMFLRTCFGILALGLPTNRQNPVNLLIFHVWSWVPMSHIYSWLIRYRNGKYSTFTHNTVSSHTLEAMFFTSEKKSCFSYVLNWCCWLQCAMELCSYYTHYEYR
jgi:hypothetical protein